MSAVNEKDITPYANDHKLQQMVVVLCTQGELQVCIDMKNCRLKPASIMTICPDQNVRLTSLTEDFEGYVVAIQRELLASAFYVKNVTPIESILFRSPVVNLNESSMAVFALYFACLDEIVQRLRGRHPEIIRCHLMSLLMSLKAIYREREVDEEEETLTRSKIICHDFVQLVRRHYAEQHQLKFYADRLCVTPKHLMAVVKKELQKNPKRFIDEAIIADAKYQLMTTDLSMKQICDNLNFPNPSFFGKFFKQHVGVSPNTYRKEGVKSSGLTAT